MFDLCLCNLKTLLRSAIRKRLRIFSNCAHKVSPCQEKNGSLLNHLDYLINFVSSFLTLTPQSFLFVFLGSICYRNQEFRLSFQIAKAISEQTKHTHRINL